MTARRASPAPRHAVRRSPPAALDAALAALRARTGVEECLVALLSPGDGLELRSSGHAGAPDEAMLRRAAARAMAGGGEATFRAGPRRMLGAFVGAGDAGACVAALPHDARNAAALRQAAPAVLLELVRDVLVAREGRHAAEVDRMHATAQRIAAFLDVDRILSEIVRDAVELLGGSSGDLVLRDRWRDVLRVVAVANFPPEMLGFEMALGEGLSSRAMALGRAVTVADYERSRYRVRRLDRYRFRAVVCAPMIARGEAIGALNVHATEPGRRFDHDDARTLTIFANYAAVALDNARRLDNEHRLARELVTANEELVRSLTLQQQVAEQVLLDKGLNAVVEKLAGLLARTVVVQDDAFYVIAEAAPDGSEVERCLPLPRDAASRTDLAPHLSELAAGRAVILPGGRGARRLIAPVVLGEGRVSGYLLVPWRDDPEPLDRALIEVASTGVALELAKLSARVEVEHRVRGEAVQDLVTGAYTSPDAIRARMAHLGHDLAVPHRVLLVRLGGAEDGTHVEEGALLELERRLFDAVRRALRGRTPDGAASHHGGLVVVLVPRLRDTAHAVALAEALRAAAGERVPGHAVSVAVGRECAAPADYADAFREASETLDAMARLGRASGVWSAEELGVYRLLIASSTSEELEPFARRTLGPLLDDARHGPALLETLRAYVDAGFNQRETARRAHLHTNTVAYRLRRVEEMLGASLADADRLLELTLSIRIATLAGWLGERTVSSPQRTRRNRGAERH